MMVTEVSIRDERTADHLAIRRVHERAFSGKTEAWLVGALRAHGRLVVSLVAEERGMVIGHIGFSPVTVTGAADGVGLAPVAVVPERQNAGVGAALIRQGLVRCRERGHRFVVLLGSPEYYARFGFQPASRFGFADEYAGGPAFQALELHPGALAQAGGVLKYAEEFAVFASVPA